MKQCRKLKRAAAELSEKPQLCSQNTPHSVQASRDMLFPDILTVFFFPHKLFILIKKLRILLHVIYSIYREGTISTEIGV